MVLGNDLFSLLAAQKEIQIDARPARLDEAKGRNLRDKTQDMQFWDTEIDKQFWQLAKEFECLLQKYRDGRNVDRPMTKTEVLGRKADMPI